jgi:hypothetical protein
MEPEVMTEQPSGDSVESRIGSIFGNEQPQQPEAATPPETVEETFELEMDGAKYVLPKKLEKGFMQEKDYTQKSQTLAEQRKDVELKAAQFKLAQSESSFRESVAPDLQQMAVIDAVLQEYDRLNWAGMSTDELIRKRLERDQYKEARTALDQGLQAKRSQFDQHVKAETERLRSEASETLKKRINWSDETESEVRSYVKELGITDAEYDGVFDPRHKQILFEASQFRKLKAAATPAVQQVKAVKANATNPMPQQVKERLAFNKQLKQHDPGTAGFKQAVERQAGSLFRKR